MTLTEKIAYIKGLTEGLSLDEKKDEVKVLNAIIDLLDDMALTVADLEEVTDEMNEVIDVIDKDLNDVEQIVYDAEDDECCCDDDCDCDCDCDDCGEVYNITCKACKRHFLVDEEDLDEGEINCPYCGENNEFNVLGTINDEEEEEK